MTITDEELKSNFFINKTIKINLDQREFIINQELKKLFIISKYIDLIRYNSIVISKFNTWMILTEIHINNLQPETLEHLAKDAGYIEISQLFGFNYYIDDVVGEMAIKYYSKINKISEKSF